MDLMDCPELLVFPVNKQEILNKYYCMISLSGAQGMKGEQGDYGLSGSPGPMGETADAEKGDRGYDGMK